MIENKVKHFGESIFHDIIKTAIYSRVSGSQYFNRLSIDITFEQYIALDAISCNDNICQRDLSKIILKDRSNTGRIVNILEERGFIERSVETKNNRLVKKLKITEEGKKLLEEHNEIIRKDTESIFEDITEEEIETLRDLLAKIRKCLSKEATLQI